MRSLSLLFLLLVAGFADAWWMWFFAPGPVLVLVLLVVGFALSVFLWIGTLWFQGYIYSEPAPELTWRAPAAGAALTVFLALWCLLDYRAAGPESSDPAYNTLWEFNAIEEYPAKGWPQFWSVEKGQEVKYVRQQGDRPGSAHYVAPEKDNRSWNRDAGGGLVQAIIIEENGQRVRFNLDLPQGAKLKSGELARYKEVGGRRVLTEEDVVRGRMSRFRTARFLVNTLLNVVFLGLWFVCLWLLLRFQWPHALGLAVVLWVIMMFAVLPLVLDRAQKAAQARPRPAPVAAPS